MNDFRRIGWSAFDNVCDRLIRDAGREVYEMKGVDTVPGRVVIACAGGWLCQNHLDATGGQRWTGRAPVTPSPASVGHTWVPLVVQWGAETHWWKPTVGRMGPCRLRLQHGASSATHVTLGAAAHVTLGSTVCACEIGSNLCAATGRPLRQRGGTSYDLYSV